MAKILVASVPLSGHVNPAIPLVKMLIHRGHQVWWYCGSHYQERIEATGARFFPYLRAKDFHDSSIKTVFPGLPEGSLFKHATHYIQHVFFDNMSGQYADLLEILKNFDADVLLTDEWFCGAIPLAEKAVLPWVCYCNSPLFYYTHEIPFPGAGIYPSATWWGRGRNRMVNWMVTKLIFRQVQHYINRLRQKLDLAPMTHFFLIHTIFVSRLFIKFNTPAFEFCWKQLPPQIRFVGPMLPENGAPHHYKWTPLLHTGQPIIFITQGTVNINHYNNLILPALRALQNTPYLVLVATGTTSTQALEREFACQQIFIETFIPYEFIMPHASVVITNGGFGGVITALAHGIPLVVAGSTEDKPEIAARVNYCKVGINLGTKQPTAPRIRKAVDQVLNNKMYKNNAKQIQADFAMHNAANETIQLIEDLIKETTN
ncbi:MAG: nucleotide disphospho-sugar-binding domain-containing protein [Bacteroidota bacterium]